MTQTYSPGLEMHAKFLATCYNGIHTFNSPNPLILFARVSFYTGVSEPIVFLLCDSP